MGIMLVVVGGAMAFWAFGRARLPWTAFVDCSALIIIGAIVGGRVLHVALNDLYFAVHPAEIIRLDGLEWRGAVIGALLGMWLGAHFHHLPLPDVGDAFAPLIPLLGMGGCAGCLSGRCMVGVEVRSLADFPAWVVTETPDIYDTVAPRLNLPGIGLALCCLIGMILLGTFALNRCRGGRLWLCLGLLGMGMAVLSLFRAEYVPLWGGVRADIILDLFLTGFGFSAFGWTWIQSHRRTGRRAINVTAVGG